METENTIYDLLNQPLDRERVGKRAGAGGRQLSYLEGYDVIDTLNRIFGYDGWSYNPPTVERIGERIWRATVRLEVDFGERKVYRGDTGIGIHRTDAPEEVEKAVKEAVTDALKRAARTLGNQFGNCLYDKDAPEHQTGINEARAAYQGATGNPAPNNGQSRNGSAPACNLCGGEMWDNRPKKASGEYSANRPDFSCKKKINPDCKGVIWPPKDGNAPRNSGPTPEQLKRQREIPIGPTPSRMGAALSEVEDDSDPFALDN